MKIWLITAIAVFITLSGPVMADKNPGAVMAVDQNGVDDKLYPTTEIFIKGVGLLGDTAFEWDIYDMAVTCPPETVDPGIGCSKLLKHGSGGMTSNDGSITPYQDSGWSIPDGDYVGHPYKLVVTVGPTDQSLHPTPALFYTKTDSFNPVPEASTMILTIMGIFGIFMVSRKYRQK